jgi:hypothetical protein
VGVTNRQTAPAVETPGDEYRRRLDARRAVLDRLVRVERAIADARLIIFVLGAVVAWLVFVAARLSAAWLVVPLVAFAALVVVHERVRRAAHRATRAVTFYDKALARVEDRWMGAGETGERFLDPEHPYAADLDLFGKGSLFERLCTARTRAGEETLARWLLRPAGVDEVHERHAAVADLRDRLDLREELELLGSDVRAGLDPDALAAWGSEPRAFIGGRWAMATAAGALAALGTAALIGWALLGTGPSPFCAVVIVDVLLTIWTSHRVRLVIAALDQRTHDLVLLAALLARLEHETFEAPALSRLQSALETTGLPASRRIARLARLLHLLDCQKNQFFAPIAGVLLWSLQLALAIDAWRARSGPAIASWLTAVGEFEALCALASYAWECPGEVVPEVEPGTAGKTAGVWFEAERLGHPLIPEVMCVRNDVGLGGARQVLVVSGSNMSGKSTLLRTVGINAVLALAGAPVRARRLRLTPLAIGATLRIQDSLQAGRSRFFAEVTRVRQLVDQSRGPIPLLFLLDELFHGTNSHDRRVGAEAVVRGLIDRGAIGLLTTHDLALTTIVERLAPHAENVHFEDQFVNGLMHFDYRMRPGVVQHSNALALMRAVGLDV